MERYGFSWLWCYWTYFGILILIPLLIRHDLVWQGTQITHTASTGLPLGFHWASTGLPLHLLSMHQKVQCQEFGAVSCVNPVADAWNSWVQPLSISDVFTLAQPRPQYVMHSFTLTLKIHLDLAAQPQFLGSSADRPTVRTHCWVFQMPISKYNISCIQIAYPILSIANLLPKVLDNLSSEPSPSFTKSILGASGHTAHGTTASFGVPLRHWGNSGRSNGRSKCRSTTYHHISPHITAYQHTNYSLWIFMDLCGSLWFIWPSSNSRPSARRFAKYQSHRTVKKATLLMLRWVIGFLREGKQHTHTHTPLPWTVGVSNDPNTPTISTVSTVTQW